ncbi:MAG: L-threonylcarbamoyladenylate synthase [Candidatus Gracilibacteria bacterium]|jgi:L-threonylcarbamoyladenylate synthase
MNTDWRKIISVLKSGGVVTHPTDTCYGLACDIFNEKAVYKLYKLKQMPKDKPLSIIVGSLDQAREYGIFNEIALELAGRGWPGDLTLVLNRTDKVPVYLNRGVDTIGIRVPGDKFTLEMLKMWGGPLSTTSANLSGGANPYSSGEALRGDYVVEVGHIPVKKPSTIVRVVGDKVEILRQGELEISR